MSTVSGSPGSASGGMLGDAWAPDEDGGALLGTLAPVPPTHAARSAAAARPAARRAPATETRDRPREREATRTGWLSATDIGNPLERDPLTPSSVTPITSARRRRPPPGSRTRRPW